MVVSAFANLDLNIEPSHATTPWCWGTSFDKNGGKIWQVDLVRIVKVAA